MVRHAINTHLARFERDWATEEIVKQFVKNKRKNHYTNGWLEVPDRYAYLKNNSKKRNPAGPRVKKALKNTRSGDNTVEMRAEGSSSVAGGVRTVSEE